MKKIMDLMWGKSRSRKGITPVIAIVLLLMMTVAAAGMAYVWIQSVQEQVQTETQTSITAQQRDQTSRMVIESVYKDGSNHVSVVIRNKGTYTFDDDELLAVGVYKDNVPLTAGTDCSGMTGTGTICTFVETGTSFPDDGEVAVFRVEPPFGQGGEFICNSDGDVCQ